MEEGLEVVTGLHGDVRDLGWQALSPNIYRLISRMASGAVTGFFALAGAFMGVLSGALAGRASDTGIIRGAALGAIAGAVLAIEVLEAYHAYWRSNQSNSHNTYDAGPLRQIDIKTKNLRSNTMKFEIKKYDVSNSFGIWRTMMRGVFVQQDIVKALMKHSKVLTMVGEVEKSEMDKKSLTMI